MAEAPPRFEAPLTFGAQIELRATRPETEEKIFLYQRDRAWTYRRFRDESVRMAHFLLGRLGPCDESRAPHVAILLDNHLELLALYGGCAYAGLTLFGINTGLRGEPLAGVINHSRSRLLVVDERLLPEVERIQSHLKHVAPENLLILGTRGGPDLGGSELMACAADEVGGRGASLEAPGVDVRPDTNLMVIYTSGTTGLPKGINNNHFKCLVTGIGVSRNCGVEPEDVGYACMPLFHSNSVFIGFSPAFWVGGSLVVRDRFGASGFLPDVLRYGVTYWNYVGEPVHYVLAAVEQKFGGDEERIRAEVTNSSRNKFRFAVGNGASPADIDRFSRWFGLDEMYELYGSTEAAISTFGRRGDPRGSVGEITDPDVKILDEHGEECPPAQIGPDGRLLDYAEAVGEICRGAPDTALFQGYFDNPEANAAKYRDGVYHSGDLGHVVVQDGRRFLYFDGRTDDWIRKDGENFSAAQVAQLVAEHPDVALAAAYGVPCPVSDELVMVALKLRPGGAFDPRGFFEFCERSVKEGSMDRKWFPDFVRIVDDFEFTETQKIVVRGLKRDHFHLRRLPDARLFWRERRDTAFRPLTAEDFEVLHSRFEAAERLRILEP